MTPESTLRIDAPVGGAPLTPPARFGWVPRRLVAPFGLVALAVAMVLLARSVDGAVLATGARAAWRDPAGVSLAMAGFAAAFLVRSVVWHRLVRPLGPGDAWSAIHVSLAANHVLPLRLGEAVRPLVAARRSGLRLDILTASTVALRAADIMAMAGLGLALAPAVFLDAVGWWGAGLFGIVALLGVASVVWLTRQPVSGRVRLGDPVVLVGTVVAWVAEATVVWQCASWAGVHLTYTDAVVVTVCAVSAQIVAIAPGGVGTYEAAAATAMVATGVPMRSAVAVAVLAHCVKTVYALASGAAALRWPSPPLTGRLRLARPASRPTPPPSSDPSWDRTAGIGPVVLVLPARNEAERIGAVIGRIPREVAGRATVCVVVDDGSTDATAQVARELGAVVVAHRSGCGLGAAVRTGLAAAVSLGASAVAFCDADGEYAPEELGRLVRPILDGERDYVVGSRFRGRIDHMRPHRRFGNQLLTRLVRWTARTPVTDGQSGFRALSRQAAERAEIIHDYNYAQVLTLDLLGKGFRYGEVPISYHFRRSGRSFVRLGPYLRAVLPAVWRELNTGAPSMS